MKPAAIDTNVLLHAANRSSADHAPCADLVRARHSSPVPTYFTWGVMYEFLRVATHPRVWTMPLRPHHAWAFLAALLSGPAVTILTHTQRHRPLLERVLETHGAIKANLFHDAHLALLLQEHGVSLLYTCDADFQRFEFLEVIDPVDIR